MSRFAIAFVACCCALFSTSCGAVPSKRIQELLVKRGLGKRAEGDAQVENYATVSSQIQFFAPTYVMGNPTYADLLILAASPQTVGIDGSIYIPGYGTTYVLGLTEKQIGALVSEQLRSLYTDAIHVDARILSGDKFYYMFGETTPGIRRFEGDMTVLDIFARNPILPLANIGKIRLVRADPRNPLIVTINVRDIVLYGISTYNINIKENDIIYVPPTFFGSVSRFIEKVTAPLTSVLNAAFRASNLRYQYRVLTGQQEFFPFQGGFGGGGGGFLF